MSTMPCHNKTKKTKKPMNPPPRNHLSPLPNALALGRSAKAPGLGGPVRDSSDQKQKLVAWTFPCRSSQSKPIPVNPTQSNLSTTHGERVQTWARLPAWPASAPARAFHCRRERNPFKSQKTSPALSNPIRPNQGESNPIQPLNHPQHLAHPESRGGETLGLGVWCFFGIWSLVLGSFPPFPAFRFSPLPVP